MFAKKEEGIRRERTEAQHSRTMRVRSDFETPFHDGVAFGYGELSAREKIPERETLAKRRDIRVRAESDFSFFAAEVYLSGF